MLRFVVLLTLIVYGLSLFSVALVPHGKVIVVRTSSFFSEQLVGFAINLHHTTNLAAHRQAIDVLKKLGFNSILILTPAFQKDCNSQQVQVRFGPKDGPDRDQLIELIRYAGQREMNTVLMPAVLLTDPRGNEWRGKIRPPRWQPWWESYFDAMDQFTDIAIEAGATVLCIGSELLSTEGQTEQWIKLIRHIRRRFDGPLIYSTNWDHYHVPKFWPHLDAIAINAYWDITTKTDPQHPVPAALTARWTQIRKELLAFAEQQSRPVLFTEVGYPSLPWALKDPWNYLAPTGTQADHQAQVRGYTAFLQTWADLIRPPAHFNAHREAKVGPVAGLFFYEWDVHRFGGDSDTQYGVRGKPTLELLRHWLRHGQLSPITHGQYQHTRPQKTISFQGTSFRRRSLPTISG